MPKYESDTEMEDSKADVKAKLFKKGSYSKPKPNATLKQLGFRDSGIHPMKDDTEDDTDGGSKPTFSDAEDANMAEMLERENLVIGGLGDDGVHTTEFVKAACDAADL